MTAYEHQTRAFERFKEAQYGALFLEQGLGKSKIAIDLANHKFNEEKITGVLVVTPKSLIDNWALKEIPKWSDNSELDTILAWSTKLNFNFPKTMGLTWFVCNIDAIITEKWVNVFRLFYKTHPKFMLIIDESTTCKTPNSQRTKRMMQIADYAQCRFILSGTPITNSPLDIWAQAEILNPGIMGRNYFMFKNHYAIQERVQLGTLRTFMKIKGYQNLEELSKKINTFSVIAKKKDCLDLPPKIYRQIPVALSDEQKQHYMNFKQLALTQIDNQTLTVPNAVSLINSLLQICAGQIKMPDGTYKYLETNRIALLDDIIDESEEKSLIWCSFVGAADIVEQKLPTLKKDEPNRVLRIRAETKDVDRNEILELFKSSPEKYSLLLNQASMGKGHTILEGRNMIFYSQRFSVEQREHAEDRPHRIGQTKSILINEFYSPGTFEEKVIKVLRESREMANKIITDRSTLRELIMS